MTSYLNSTPARLLALALAVPLLSGLALQLGAGPTFYALPLVGALGLTFVALGLSVETHAGAAISVIIALPVVVFAFLATVGFLVPATPSVVYLMAALGCALLVVAVRPNFARSPMAPAMRPRKA